MPRARFVLRLLAALFVLSTLAGVGALSLGIAMAQRELADLPEVSRLREHTTSSTTHLLAGDQVIGQFAEQHRVPVRYAALPPMLVQAFISAEDKLYWSHNGVDPSAVARAMVTNLRNRSAGRRAIGASTITQQVAKNLLVGDEASLRRKLREAMVATRLDRELGKEKVLELYLNEIYLGQGAYGVAAAADTYFGRPMDQLSLAEMSFLAGLPKGPANYDPIKRPDAAYARRAYVLGRLLEDGHITGAQLAEARSAPLPRPSGQKLGGIADGFFAEEARREVVAQVGSGALYRAGLVVRTSMDPELQRLAEGALRDGLVGYDRRHGWRGPVSQAASAGWRPDQPESWRMVLAGVNPPPGAEDWRLALVLGFREGHAIVGLSDGSWGGVTAESLKWARRAGPRGLGPVPRKAEDVLKAGDVVLVSGGHGAAREQAASQARFELQQVPLVQGSLVALENRTGRVLAVAGGFSFEQGSFNRATQAQRQPGSTIKPIIYLAGFEQGMDPTSPVLDSPISIEVGHGVPRWEPQGGANRGLITMRQALEGSRNYSSVRLLYDLGLEPVAETARKLGVYERLPNFAAALGALETTNLRMTTAYAMLANGGRRVVPGFIDSIETSQGEVLYRHPPAEQAPVVDPVAAAQLVSVMEGVVRRGTAASVLGKVPHPIAGKTGTTNDSHDAWFVGVTPDIAVGVHVGFDRPHSLGGTETGGHAAAPIFGDFIQRALAVRPPSSTSFPVPEGARQVRLDPVSGEEVKSGGVVEIQRQE